MKALKISLIINLALMMALTVQSQTILNGKLTDMAGKPLSFANVLLLKATDSSLVKGTVASESGSYQLAEVPAGDYLLSLRMIGYQAKYKSPIKINKSDKQIDLGADILEVDVMELSEVLVESQKPLFEQHFDKLVMNVQSSMTSIGGSALDVLEKAPGISANRQNGMLSMNGKNGVLVMINGKMNRLPMQAVMQLLSGMSAANIDKIELISNPSAKYDAEGDAGIINIVLKENEDAGTNGNFSLTGGYGHAEKAGASINLNHRTQKVNVYGDYSFLRNHTSSIMKNHRFIDFEGVRTSTDAVSYRDPIIFNHTARLGLDYSLSKRTIVGLLFSGYSNKWTMNAMNDIRITSTTEPPEFIDMKIGEINHWSNVTGNFNISHKINNTHSLSLDLDYLLFYDNNPSDYLNHYQRDENNIYQTEEVKVKKNTPINIWVAKADYALKIGDHINIETGLKSTFSRFTNDVSVQSRTAQEWTYDPALTSIYFLKEDIGAAYSSIQTDIVPGLEINGGLRYEYTRSLLNSREQRGIVDRKYGNLFPNLALAKKINEHHKVNISYNKRITRPTFNDMAPFVIFVDPFTFFSGNASVQPAYTNAVKFDYSFKNHLLSLQYSRDNNAIAMFQPLVLPDKNIQLFATQNFRYIQTYSISLALPFKVGKFWEMQNNLMAFRQQVAAHYTGREIMVEQFSLRINSTHNFRLPKDYSIELSGLYQSPTMLGIYTFRPLGAVNLGLQKKLKEDKGTFTLSFSDIFWTTTWKGSVNIPEENMNIVFNYFFEPRVLRLTYTLSFGNKSLKSLRKRSPGSEEERSRVTN